MEAKEPRKLAALIPLIKQRLIEAGQLLKQGYDAGSQAVAMNLPRIGMGRKKP